MSDTANDDVKKVVVHLNVSPETRAALRTLAANGGMYGPSGTLLSVSDMVSTWAQDEVECLGLVTNHGGEDSPSLPSGVSPSFRVDVHLGNSARPRNMRLDQVGELARNAVDRGFESKNKHISVDLTTIRPCHRSAVIDYLQAQMPEGLRVDDDKYVLTGTTTEQMMLALEDLRLGLRGVSNFEGSTGTMFKGRRSERRGRGASRRRGGPDLRRWAGEQR